MEIRDLVFKLLDNQFTPIFLTGKAGTGKTTLLHEIKLNSSKNSVVVAFTSIAALNAGGVTMHSFFQMPLGPLIPQAGFDLLNNDFIQKYNPEKLAVIRSLELIIIDEISMVRADMLDHLDLLLRRINLTEMPFGGVQLLMIGDPLQLPPVKDHWPILSGHYENPYFFASKVLKKVGFISVELQKVYRQADPDFVDVLNHARIGGMTPDLFARLNERFDLTATTEEMRPITITTHHKIVNEINEQNLQALPGEIFSYPASISGDFKADPLPADALLRLKVGARVIMVRNDDSGYKSYYNGREAVISKLTSDGVTVSFLDDGNELEITPQTWNSLKYELDESGKRARESVTGTFSQYPVRLAWAITVHKSQGLTFDRVELDIAACFEYGQAYVALSRCRSLDGIRLRTKVLPDNIKTDPVAVDFMAGLIPSETTEQQLERIAIKEQYRIVENLFDFSPIAMRIAVLETVMQGTGDSLLAEIIREMRKKVIRPAAKFLAEEVMILNREQPVLGNEQFRQRLFRAASYFQERTGTYLEAVNQVLAGQEDLKAGHSRSVSLLSELYILLSIKWEIYKWINKESVIPQIRQIERFQLLQSVKEVSAQKKQVLKNPHPKLLERLIDWRRDQSKARSLPPHIIMSDKAIIGIIDKAPRTIEQLAAVPGIGLAKAKQVGNAILEILNSYFSNSELF